MQEAVDKGMEIIRSGKDISFGLLLVCGVNFGLRISDLLPISYGELKSGEFLLAEQKTGKRRKIVVNSVVKGALEAMEGTSVREERGGAAFVSQKGTVYSQQHVNRLMKKYFDTSSRKISTHSMRKSFGRRVYEKSEGKKLPMLQMQFNHSTPEVTLRYIGITQDQLDGMYEGLV